jgi:putative phage-type endonuclease
MIFHSMEQGSEAWHEIKLGRFTGSRVSALFSAKSTANYQNLIANIAAEIITQDKDDGYVSADMERGIELEPEARRAYEAITGYKVEQVGFIENEDLGLGDWVGVSPDGVIDRIGLLEIKCPKANTMFQYYLKNMLPSGYYWQVHFQMFITGYTWCDFFAYYPGMNPFMLRVHRDEEAIAKLQEALEIGIEDVKTLLNQYKSYGVDN